MDQQTGFMRPPWYPAALDQTLASTIPRLLDAWFYYHFNFHLTTPVFFHSKQCSGNGRLPFTGFCSHRKGCLPVTGSGNNNFVFGNLTPVYVRNTDLGYSQVSIIYILRPGHQMLCQTFWWRVPVTWMAPPGRTHLERRGRILTPRGTFQPSGLPDLLI